CFQPLRGVRLPTFDTALSLREWWQGRGLSLFERALGNVVLFNDVVRSGKRYVVSAPDARRTLTTETSHDPRLRRLLCPTATNECGAETRGWVNRAEAAFARIEAGPKHRPKSFAADFDRVSEEECADEASKPASDRYPSWLACMEITRSRVP